MSNQIIKEATTKLRNLIKGYSISIESIDDSLDKIDSALNNPLSSMSEIENYLNLNNNLLNTTYIKNIKQICNDAYATKDNAAEVYTNMIKQNSFHRKPTFSS